MDNGDIEGGDQNIPVVGGVDQNPPIVDNGGAVQINANNPNGARVRPKRRCSVCNELGYHDSRNCPEKRKEMIQRMENALNRMRNNH